MRTRLSLATALLCCAAAAPLAAGADPWEVHREVREGAYNIERERQEAAREIRRCDTRECAMRETREGKREVDRERHEARHEIQAERGYGYGNGYRPPAPHYAYNTPYRYHYGNARYYGDSRYYGGGHYYGRNYWDGVAHFHPGGQFCREARHVVHYRDGYYRNDGRWYRDGRHWNESAYVNRYYRQRHDHDDNDDLVRGIVIGAAVVGVIAAVHEANDRD